MIGITSYGAYLPRLRLSRAAIVQSMGWFAPAIMAVTQGKRAMCNRDEGTLTMAVAAATVTPMPHSGGGPSSGSRSAPAQPPRSWANTAAHWSSIA